MNIAELVASMQSAQQNGVMDIVKKTFNEFLRDHSCSNPRHCYVVRDAGDWEAVHNMMHLLTIMHLKTAREMVQMAAKAFKDAISPPARGSTRSALSEVLETVALTAEFEALELMLAAHNLLRDRGAMELRNADMYYEQIIGIVEEDLARSKSRGAKARPADRQHSCAGHGDQSREQGGEGAQESPLQAGEQTTP